jgi:hypothetical protein
MVSKKMNPYFGGIFHPFPFWSVPPFRFGFGFKLPRFFGGMSRIRSLLSHKSR